MGSLTDRNKTICALRDAGATYGDIARQFSLSKTRIPQIIAKQKRMDARKTIQDLSPESTIADALDAYRMHQRTWLTSAAACFNTAPKDMTLAQLYSALLGDEPIRFLTGKGIAGLLHICREAGCLTKIERDFYRSKGRDEIWK